MMKTINRYFTDFYLHGKTFPEAVDTFVLLEYLDDEKALIYSVIGEHAEIDINYIEECCPISKKQYMDLTKNFYTYPEYLEV